MLERLEINNFRCLRGVAAPLRPLTVLIGPNDSGKSSFLSALLQLKQPSLSVDDFWLREHRNDIAIRCTGPNWSATLQGSLGALQQLTLKTVVLPADGVRMSSEVVPDEAGPPPLEGDGSGLPTLLDHLLRVDRPRFDAFGAAVRTYFGDVQDVVPRAASPATRRLFLRFTRGFELSAERCSTGVRAMLFYLGMAYHPNPPDLILLEEPENGVHPKRLADIMKLLRSITKGEHCGHAAQIILTTHSPYLLDHVNLDEDQVLVFKRNDDGSRTAEPVDRERLKDFLDDFMLGEVWFNQGEEGLVSRKGEAGGQA